MHVGIAGDARHVAERLLHRLAERNTDIFSGVMMIDVEVAFGLDLDIDPRMPRQEIKHVIEEADTGRDRRTALAVEVDGNLDRGLLGGPLHGRLTHGIRSWAPRLLSGL